MKKLLPASLLLLPFALSVSSPCAFAADDDGFVPFFNDNDFSGWVNVNCAPETFTIKDGVIHCTGFPTGALRTERQYENFILEAEWRHLKEGGNSGIFLWGSPVAAPGVPFLRGIEAQVLDHGYGTSNWFTTHGDVFPIHGATMKPFPPARGSRSFPSENRSKGAPEWNHYRIECNDGTVRLHVNGKEVSGGSNCNYRKGYLALESEGSPVEFRNVRIKELPSTNAGPDVTAPLSKGFVPLYNGLDLRGWKAPEGTAGHWQPKDWVLHYDGKSEAAVKDLWTEKDYGDFELIIDWRLPKNAKREARYPKLLADGNYEKDADGKDVMITFPGHGDSGIFLRGSSKSQINIWSWPNGSGEIWGYRTDAATPADKRAQYTPSKKMDRPFGQWNRFEITLKGDRVTVVLNGETVIENAHLHGIPESGPIGLQHHGDMLDFANIYIREL